MTWRLEKTDEGEDLIWDGVEFGISPSPTKGTANIQNANIATLSGEVLASYNRVAQQPSSITGGTLTPDGATNFTGPANLQVGQWINVTTSTVTSISTTTTPTTVDIEYLAVGGGGGGGGASSLGTNFDATAGGGGAGEVEISTAALAVGSYAVVIGNGGTGGSGTGTAGTNGTNTTIGSGITAIGGGGGGGTLSTDDDGLTGGSGGGGGGEDSLNTAGTGGTGTAGFNGGAGNVSGASGGGGGAAAVGTAAGGSSSTGGNGGAGVASSISGSYVTYGGGGGSGAAGGVSPNPGNGGSGGGGSGGETSGSGVQVAAVSGEANTGGGGGGAGATDLIQQSGADGGSGIAIISYTTGSVVATGGTITTSGTNTIHTFTSSGTFRVLVIPKANQYYVSYKSGTTFKLSSKFDPTGANALTHGTTGSITFSTVAVPNQVISKSVEKYTTATGTEYRYYLLDLNSYVWVFDSLINSTYGTQWMLPDPNDYSAFNLTGIGALNGQLISVGKALLLGKPTVDLGRLNDLLTGAYLNEPFPTHRSPVLVGNQGKMYYGDGNYIGEIFPTTSLITSVANIQSLCSYTASTTTGTINAVIAGSLPYSPDGKRIPVVFFTDVYGTQPTNLTTGTVYYINYNTESETFTVHSGLTTGSAIDIAAGEVGTQYFTTFFPYGSVGNGSSTPTVQISTQRVNMPANEVVQSLVEVGNTIIIGGKSSILYPWNQIDATPSDFIALPEADVKTMVNVNNMAYVFAGNKGNIYVTNGSVASLALKVPDYCAGVPGTPLTYIEPVFTWGDADYLRGRVYFSILDQTATKAGNCGGIWSFIPSQNVDPSQEVGMALRLENQQSYGDYDGYATIILPNQVQTVTSPQYWAAWQDSYSTGTSAFGIDYTGTVPVTTYVVETDLIPTGTLLAKNTFTQLEYKLSTPLASGDSVQLFWRINATDAWTSAGTTETETANPISGYYSMAFQKTQWVQFRAVSTTSGTTASSFVRLSQIRLR